MFYINFVIGDDNMFSGSDEFVLREIADGSHKIKDVLMKNAIELEFANNLKLYEMGIIDEKEFNRRYEDYKFQQQQVDKYIFN